METNKVVINTCYGGFGMSDKMIAWLHEHGANGGDVFALKRHDKLLVEAVENLGSEASAEHSSLTVVEIQGNIYRITDYDGWESIETPLGIDDWIIIEK